MDTLTHALLGASVSFALFGEHFGRRAAAVGAFAGVLPDVDSLISGREDPLLYVEFHRYFTHSLFFALCGSLLAVLPWILRVQHRQHWFLFWMCALPAYMSHCLLDAATTYGTQIFWPFTRERIGWDIISIIDPIFTLTVAALLTLGLVKHRIVFAVAAITFALAYLGTGALQRSRPEKIQEALAFRRSHSRERSEIMPTLGNNLVWRSLYLSQGRIHSDRIRVGWFSPASVREGTSLPLVTQSDLTSDEQSANSGTDAYNRFARFSDGWLARSPGDASVLGDMRYSISTEAFDPVWGIRLLVNHGKGQVEWVNRSRERRPQTAELWSEVTGKHTGYKKL